MYYANKLRYRFRIRKRRDARSVYFECARCLYEVWFHYIVAVSAGTCNGLSYMSRQQRRARISNIDMLAKYNYIGL